VIKYQSLFRAREMDSGSSVRVDARLVCGRQASDWREVTLPTSWRTIVRECETEIVHRGIRRVPHS
jgi:hypothetical protein